MKTHEILRTYIPQITFLDEDCPETAEGECRLWGRDECTFLLDTEDYSPDTLHKIAEQIYFLEDNRADILQGFSEYFSGSLGYVQIRYVAFFVDDNSAVSCDFALDCGNGQLALCSLENDKQLMFNGFEQDEM